MTQIWSKYLRVSIQTIFKIEIAVLIKKTNIFFFFYFLTGNKDFLCAFVVFQFKITLETIMSGKSKSQIERSSS